MAARVLSLAVLLLPVVLLPAPAQAQGVTPVVASLAAGYGPETWKDEPPVGQAVPGGLPLPVQPGALGVYENPYANLTPHQGAATWLGYNLTAVLELRDGSGQVDPTATRVVAARIDTVAGAIPAKLARLAPGRFAATFDLDGEDGAGIPPLPPGQARLMVEVYQTGADPTVARSRIAAGEFALEMASASLDRGGFLLPEGELPGYREVGAGNRTLVQGDLARPGEAFQVTASLGIPGQPATLVGWHRNQGTVLAQARTDALGRLTASVDPAQLTGANRSGMTLLEAHLDGADGRLASAVVGVPVSSHATRVTRYLFEPRALPGTETPIPQAATLLVGVEDLSAGQERPVRGTLYAIDPAGERLTSVPFEPTSFAPASEERLARIPAVQLGQGLATYRVLAILLTEDGRLYSLAQGVRGYAVSAAPAQAAPFERGTLEVVVRNFNNNLDDQRDPGMALPVRVRVTGLPGGAEHDGDLVVEESGEGRVAVPFSGDAGNYAVSINTTSGELAQDLRAGIAIAAARTGFLGLPGPEPGLALLALGLAAHRARTRR